MASFDFPASPNDNDTYSLNGVTYKYVAAKQRWEIVPTPHNFETTAQLDIRDTANRDRANHTGTQDVSTITGLNSVTTSVTAPSSPIAGDVWWDSETGDKYIYYVDVDGGQWVQSSSSSNLLTADVGTAAYLDVEEVATSQQGVKADSALQPSDIGTTVAPVNNPTFTGTALILPNNSRINGIEHFYQTTKPTARGDASALVAGDRWWKTDDGTEWFWNGTYWLGNEVFESRYFTTSITQSTAPSNINAGVVIPYNAFGAVMLTKFMFITRGPSIDNLSNNWIINARLAHGIATPLFSIGIAGNEINNTRSVAINLEVVIPTFGLTGSGQQLYLYYDKVGEPYGIYEYGWGCAFRPIIS